MSEPDVEVTESVLAVAIRWALLTWLFIIATVLAIALFKNA